MLDQGRGERQFRKGVDDREDDGGDGNKAEIGRRQQPGEDQRVGSAQQIDEDADTCGPERSDRQTSTHTFH